MSSNWRPRAIGSPSPMPAPVPAPPMPPPIPALIAAAGTATGTAASLHLAKARGGTTAFAAPGLSREGDARATLPAAGAERRRTLVAAARRLFRSNRAGDVLHPK